MIALLQSVRYYLISVKEKIKFYTSGGINIVDVKQVASACVNALEKGKNGESYIIGNINISLYNLFKEISLIQSVKLPRIKLLFYLTYFASFFIELYSRIFRMNPFTTRSKVISLYNYHSYCNIYKISNGIRGQKY